MTGRSRTGCLTCRQRKLKCDEERPVCGQCQKASRECVPSTGIVFRHQQNASMNSGSADDNESLKGFYAYKNTFDKNSTWVSVPKRIKFVVNADPYADLDPDFADDATPGATSQSHESLLEYTPASEWSPPAAVTVTAAAAAAANNAAAAAAAAAAAQASATLRSHGLEALSAAASDQLTYMPSTVPVNAHHMREASAHSSDMMNALSTSTPHSNPSLLSSPDNNIIQLARPFGPSPPIDPILDRASPVIRVAADLSPETDHETAFLLRHFAEGPGQWMDLFDLGNFFAHYISVKAIANPLLKHAAAAYAAKQLGRVKGRKAVMGGCSSRQARMEQSHKLSSKEWQFKGAQHYDKAISLLMEVLKDDSTSVNNNNNNAAADDDLDDAPFADGALDRKRKSTSETESLRALLSQPERSNSAVSQLKRRKVSKGKVYSDEMAAATAILCNYEFLDGSGAAWSRHLDGTKSLLDIAEGRMVPLLTPFVMPRPNISKARRATFWNFARQDMLSALIMETSQTRLDTEDLPMWKDAGLLLDAQGYIMPSNTTETGYPEGLNLMKEDMISNGLVWLIGKIINYCVAADTAPTRVGGAPQPWEGVNQHTLMEKWNELQKQLQVWADGLPDTFKPCAEVVPTAQVSAQLVGANEGSVFSEVWYASTMCASTMQSYHMARMLLLINMPQYSTLGRTTAFKRVASYKSIAADTEYHSRAICSIAAGRPDASARINSVQPLFLAGQFLERQVERAEILRLLREIQDDTGWATDYRVAQLMDIWGWDSSSSSPPTAPRGPSSSLDLP